MGLQDEGEAEGVAIGHTGNENENASGRRRMFSSPAGNLEGVAIGHTRYASNLEGVRTYASFAATRGAHTGDASNLEGVAIGHIGNENENASGRRRMFSSPAGNLGSVRRSLKHRAG